MAENITADAFIAAGGATVVSITGPGVRSRGLGSGLAEFVTFDLDNGARWTTDIDDLPTERDMIWTEDHRRRAIVVLFDPAEIRFAN